VELSIRQGFTQRPTGFEEFNSPKEAKRSILEDKPQDDAQDIPSAYPMVQPMKACVYTSSLAKEANLTFGGAALCTLKVQMASVNGEF
jgi:hypothetical protein